MGYACDANGLFGWRSGGSPAGQLFGLDLRAYLRTYCSGPDSAQMDAVCRKVADYDLAIEGVRLIASVPGYHKGADRLKWGHMVRSVHVQTSLCVNTRTLQLASTFTAAILLTPPAQT